MSCLLVRQKNIPVRNKFSSTFNELYCNKLIHTCLLIFAVFINIALKRQNRNANIAEK